MKLSLIIFFIVWTILCHKNTIAQWSNDPLVNTPVCVWNSIQQRAEIISDNKGGAIIAWFDFRMSSADIFIQRLDSDGYQKWGEGGKAVCLNTSNEIYHKIVEDGEDGCIIVWEDDRNGNSDIYAQRVDSSGNILWDSTGVEICTLPLDQEDPQIISDGSGGAIIMWEFKQGTAGETGLYAQRVNAIGQVQWATNGIPIATSPWPDPSQYKPKIVDDSNGGALIAWTDTREINDHIYAQRINGLGNILWSQNGLPVCTIGFPKRFQDMINVGNGEFILCWNTDISSNEWDLRSQKIDTTGNLFWNIAGVVVCSSDVSINQATLSYDNQDAVIISWEDHRIPGIGATIYCQKISLDGTSQWQQNGRPVSSSNGMQGFVKLICDQNGNSVACWLDARVNPQWDIYAQKFNSSGTILWEPEGKPVSTATGNKFYQHLILTTNEDYIVAWDDERGTDFDIYAQSLNSLITSVGNSSSQFLKSFILSQNYPNPFNPSTKISWQVPVGSWQTLKIYDVLGNEVASLVDAYKSAGTYEVEWDASELPSGVYFYQLKTENITETKKMILIK